MNKDAIEIILLKLNDLHVDTSKTFNRYQEKIR
jgi:hypothetical protein